MAMIRPTLILNMDIDERSFTDEMAADLRRAYTHIAAARVKDHPACEGVAEQVMRFDVKLNKPYWDASVEGADGHWNDVMLKWLSNMFYKVSSNMLAFNRMRAERGEAGLTFSWLELNFAGNVIVSIHLNPDSSIPASALEWVERARDLCNAGMLGDDVARVSIPSAASYAAQAAPHMIRREATEELVDAEADEAFEAAAVDESVEPADDFVTEVEPFEIDYSVWGITRGDGTTEEFNA